MFPALRHLSPSLLLLVFLSTASAPSALAGVFTVINTNDAGIGSLRAAIGSSNAILGPNRITFAIPGAGVQTIHLLSDLPPIIRVTAVDGTTQPNYKDAPLIEVDGAAASNFLIITPQAAHSSVKGLTLNRFQSIGLMVNADACTVSSCYIGLNAAGTAASPNGWYGILVRAIGVLIGGHTATSRNVISGNLVGVGIGAPAEQDSVMGNYIGTDATGMTGVPNATQGIEI